MWNIIRAFDILFYFTILDICMIKILHHNTIEYIMNGTKVDNGLRNNFEFEL
jgi:hypothetical protein